MIETFDGTCKPGEGDPAPGWRHPTHLLPLVKLGKHADLEALALLGLVHDPGMEGYQKIRVQALMAQGKHPEALAAAKQ